MRKKSITILAITLFLFLLLTTPIFAAGDLSIYEEAVLNTGIEVTFPSEGDSIKQGSEVTIIWEDMTSAARDSTTSYLLYYSTDLGKNWHQIVGPVRTVNVDLVYIGYGIRGSCKWTTPDVITQDAMIIVYRLWYFKPLIPRIHYNVSGVFNIIQTHRAPEAGDVLAPATPTDLKMTDKSSSTVSLSWTDRSDIESGTVIYRSLDGTNFFEVGKVGPNVTTFKDIGLMSSTLYSYRVKAYNSGGDSANSDTITALTKQLSMVLKSAPLTATDLSADLTADNEINIYWSDNSNNEDGFRIERKTGSGSFSEIAKVAANTMSYTDSGLQYNTTYTYRVRAYNSMGDSPDYTNSANAVTGSGPVAEPEVETSDGSDLVAEPEPETSAPPTVIRLFLGRNEYYVDGRMMQMDTQPISIEGRTFLPIRYVAEPLGADVSWDGSQQMVTLVSRCAGSGCLGKEIKLWIGQNMASVDGNSTPIDSLNNSVKPFLEPPGRVMLPVRFITENLGCKVDWDPVTQEVTVTSTRD